MKAQLEKELRELELIWKSGKSGLTTMEYCSTYYQIAQKIKKAV